MSFKFPSAFFLSFSSLSFCFSSFFISYFLSFFLSLSISLTGTLAICLSLSAPVHAFRPYLCRQSTQQELTRTREELDTKTQIVAELTQQRDMAQALKLIEAPLHSFFMLKMFCYRGRTRNFRIFQRVGIRNCLYRFHLKANLAEIMRWR